MRYIFFLAVLTFSCKTQTKEPTVKTPVDSTLQEKPSTTDMNLISDTGFGAVNSHTTYADLEKIFGAANLQDTMDYGAEGLDSFIVTKIYSNTPKEMIVEWHKAHLHAMVTDVYCIQERSPYHTAEGLSVGSTLDELLKANGKKINFYGTGWDYGGIITSFNGGRFEDSKILFILNSRDDATGVMGDQEMNTDKAVVKANLQKLYIAKISLNFSRQQ